MNRSNSSTPGNLPAITRREALAGLAAAAAGPLLLGWSSVASGNEPPALAGHRMYLLVPKPDAAAKFSEKFSSTWHFITRDGKPISGLLIWITAADAASLAQDSSVEALHALTTDDVSQAGDAKQSGGKVAVQIGPGDWPKPPAAGTFRTREQIAADWTTKLAAVAGVKIEVLPSEPIPPNATRVIRTNAPGQIQISYPGEQCPAEVLRLIRSEPQVYQIQWGGPQELWHCPPCGRG